MAGCAKKCKICKGWTQVNDFLQKRLGHKKEVCRKCEGKPFNDLNKCQLNKLKQIPFSHWSKYIWPQAEVNNG